MIKKLYPALALTLMLIVAVPVLSAVTKYEADGAHSTVGFSLPIMGGLSKVRGKFTDFAVSIVYDDKDMTKSTVNAVIKSASIDTGIEARDKHLRTPDFFDAEKYPEITFQSKSVEKKGKNLIAHGTFTMHGVSKEIDLPFTITGTFKDPKTGKTVLGVEAKTMVSRSAYGISFNRPDNPNFLGDEVVIELNLITKAASAQ